MVITDNVEEFAEYKESVHIVDVGPEAARTQSAFHE